MQADDSRAARPALRHDLFRIAPGRLPAAGHQPRRCPVGDKVRAGSLDSRQCFRPPARPCDPRGLTGGNAGWPMISTGQQHGCTDTDD
ncbi:MAG: hypothetical protein MZV70_37550 [Desulfobacterales bacterium]|nr:hypothetical protein [Desulfobacterales bacterium]